MRGFTITTIEFGDILHVFHTALTHKTHERKADVKNQRSWAKTQSLAASRGGFVAKIKDALHQLFEILKGSSTIKIKNILHQLILMQHLHTIKHENSNCADGPIAQLQLGS